MTKDFYLSLLFADHRLIEIVVFNSIENEYLNLTSFDLIESNSLSPILERIEAQFSASYPFRIIDSISCDFLN